MMRLITRFFFALLIALNLGAPALCQSGGEGEAGALPSLEDIDMVSELREGVSAYEDGKYLEASEIFEAYLVRNPDSPTVLMMLGACHLSLKRYITAEWLFAKSVELDPNVTDAWLGLANSRIKLDKNEEAVGAMEEYVNRQDGSDVSTTFTLATLYYQVGKLESAAKLFAIILELDDSSLDVWFNYAVTLTRLGKWPEAFAAYLRVKELSPDYDKLDYYLGVVAFQMEKMDVAEPYLRRALELEPDSATIYSALGAIEGSRKNLDVAEKYLRRALELQPDNKGATTNLISILVQNGKVDEAAVVNKSALKRWPGEVDLTYSMAVLYVHLEKYQKSRELLEPLLKKNPELLDVRRLLASLYSNRSETDKAIEQYREILKREPTDVEIRESLARSLKSSDKFEEALAQYRKLIKYVPDNEDNYRKIAILLEKMDKPDELREHYIMMVDALPDNGFAYAQLAYEAEAEGDVDKAVDLFDKALARKEIGDYGVHVHRAHYYKEAGNAIAAESLYRTGLELTLEHSREVYTKLMGDLQQSGGQLNLQKLIEIGETEKDIEPNIEAALKGVLTAFRERDDRDGAIRYLEELMKKFPKTSKLIHRLCKLEREAGNVDRVMRLTKELLDADTRNTDGHLWMAWAFEQRNDVKSAGLAYMRAVQTAPKSVEPYEGLLRSYRTQNRLAVLEPFLKNLLKKNKDIEVLQQAYAEVAAAAGIEWTPEAKTEEDKFIEEVNSVKKEASEVENIGW